MAGFRSVKQYAEAWDAGRSFTSHFRKSFTSSPSAAFYDTTLFGGGPPAQYYASTPLESAVLDGTRGIYHGDDKAPSAKFLTHFGIVGASFNNQGRYVLQDHLMYYPFVVGDDLDQQDMVNSVSLPRYEDGKGVMCMAICQSSTAGGGNFTMNYVDDTGTTRTTPTNLFHGTAMGTGNSVLGQGVGGSGITRSYVGLHSSSGGVRSINSITLGATHGGLFALVLVKPLCDLVMPADTLCNTELELITHRAGPPRIYDGAFLSVTAGVLGTPGGTAMTGYIKTIWDEGT